MESTLSGTVTTKLSGVQRLLEAGLIFSSIFSIYLILSLLSFDPSDPGWSQTAYHATINNAGGAFGAYISDILFFTFGALAYTLPFVMAVTGWLLFQKIHYILEIDFFTLGLKLIGFIMLYVGLTAIASMNFSNVYDFSAGGIVGNFVAITFLPYFNYIGSSLVFIILTCSGCVLFTGWSIFLIIDTIGKFTILAGYKVQSLLMAIPDMISSAPKSTSTTSALNNTSQPNTVTSPASEFNDSILKASLVKDETNPLDNQNSLESADDDNTDIQEAIPFSESNFEVQKQQEHHNIDESSNGMSAETEQPDLAAQFFADVNEQTFNIDDANSDEPFISIDNEPFIEIDDLIDDASLSSAEDKATTAELDAAFSQIDKLDVPDDKEVTETIVNHEIVNAQPTPFDKYKGMPTIDLLDKPNRTKNPISPEELEQVSRLVEAKLLDYGVQAQVVAVLPGPVITRFELDLAPGVKVSKITNLSKDLARALSAASVRVVEVIPGKSVIGLEIPNKHREMVQLSEIIECQDFVNSNSALAMVIGKDIAGEPIVADLGKMPHLLVAGTTGSGKSVVVNVMIISMLYKSTPEDVRFIMIDPKMLELSIYEGIPHLLSEVVTDMKDAANALRWCVGEMERRYKLMSAVGVRNLKGYNQKVTKAIADGEPLTDPLWKPGDNMLDSAPLLEKLPSIVVVVDEFADMIMIVGKKVEELIARIAQKARAAGIHLILATQRPSVDVITGLIKANIPTRMALTVSSRVDSRTILDQQGAEQLLGHGDMLYMPQGTSIPTRAQGAFVDDHEVHAVVNDWKARGKPQYVEEILSGETTEDNLLPGEVAESDDQEMDVLYDEALAHVTESRRASISGVQRKFRIGYNRAARLIEQMEASGVVSSPGHNGNREVLAPPPVK